MMTHLRESAHGIFAKLMLGILVISFGIWGIGDIFRQGGRVSDVATVGKTAISMQEYRQALREQQEMLRRRLGNNYTPDLIRKFGIDKMVRDQLIVNLLFEKETQALGIVVGDDDVVDVIRSDPGFKGADGQFDKSLYLETLANRDMSESYYVGTIRKDIAANLLNVALTSGIVPPEELVRTLYRIRQEQRVADLLVIPLSAVKKVPAPGEKDIKAYYDAHDREFSAPEYRTASYIVLKEPAAPADAEASEAAQDALNKQVNALEDTLAGGASLESAAEKIGQKVLVFGPVTRDGVSPEGKKLVLPPYDNFMNTVFATNEKDHSQAVQANDNAYFLVRVDSVQPEHVRPLAEVKNRVVAAWSVEKKQALLQSLSETIAAELRAGKKPGAVLASHGVSLSPVSSGKLKRGSETTAAKLALPDGLVRELFRLKLHESTHAYPLAGGSNIIASLTQVIPAPDVKDNSAVLDGVRNELKATMAGETLHYYINYLSGKYRVSENDAALGIKDEGSGE